MTGLPITTDALTVTFGDVRAIDELTCSFAPNQIHGVFGRNGAGKTTLLSTIAAFGPASSGQVRVGGHDPFNNGPLSRNICLIRESGDFLGDETGLTNLAWLAKVRPAFDRPYADALLAEFGVNPRARLRTMSRGQRSAFAAAVGLASRTAVTMFDEVHLGMDAVVRSQFYSALLADFTAWPRTFVVSSHLITEVESFLDTVTILDRGRLVLAGTADKVRTRGATLTGPRGVVEAYAAGLDVIGRVDLGPTCQLTVYGDLDETALARAGASGITVDGVGLQDLFIHLTKASS